jgi:hypothetical protein
LVEGAAAGAAKAECTAKAEKIGLERKQMRHVDRSERPGKPHEQTLGARFGHEVGKNVEGEVVE